MSNLVDPTDIAFIADGIPLVVIKGRDVPAMAALRIADGAVQYCDGWKIMARQTICLIDGPGEAGLITPSFGRADYAQWLELAETHGQAVVVVANGEPVLRVADLVTAAGLRGGVVPLM